MNLNDLEEKLVDFKPIYQNRLEFEKNITFGIEIECENIYLYRIKKEIEKIGSDWQYQPDVSLDITGIEVASPIYYDKKNTYIKIKQMCQILKKLKGNPNNNSAFQIHYGMQIFKDNPKYLLNFYKLWSIYENIIYRYSYGDKSIPRSNIYRYAKMCGKYINEILTGKIPLSYLSICSQEEIVKNIDNLSSILLNNHEYGLSFRYEDYINLEKTETIEIRVMNGTLDEIMIQNYIKFYYNLIAYSCSDKFDEEFINYKYNKIDYDKISINYSLKLYLENAIELANLIYEREYDKLCFLQQYIKKKN